MKKLYRSRENKTLGGLLGGIGEYFGVDPVLLRVLWIVVTIFTGLIPGVLVYIFSLFVVPRAPRESHAQPA